MQSLDEYPVLFWEPFLKTHIYTHFWETLQLFSHWSGPHDITFACGNWKVMKTLNSTFLCLFMERLLSFWVFFILTVAVVLKKWMRVGLFEEMKWLGQVSYNICAKGTPPLYYVCEIRVKPFTILWAPQSRALNLTFLGLNFSCKKYKLFWYFSFTFTDSYDCIEAQLAIYFSPGLSILYENNHDF